MIGITVAFLLLACFFFFVYGRLNRPLAEKLEHAEARTT